MPASPCPTISLARFLRQHFAFPRITRSRSRLMQRITLCGTFDAAYVTSMIKRRRVANHIVSISLRVSYRHFTMNLFPVRSADRMSMIYTALAFRRRVSSRRRRRFGIISPPPSPRDSTRACAAAGSDQVSGALRKSARVTNDATR